MNQAKSVTVVLPCLNEEKTIEYCVLQAFEGIKKSGLNGEVIVADNGSVDKSVEIAEKLGAKIIKISKRGYGSALNGGILEANSDFIIMGDADSTYDFRHIHRFTEKLGEGYDLVIGNRFSGGIEKGAMPLPNKYIGNPILSYIARKLFDSDIGDFHCGLRGFTKKSYEKMSLKSEGMEFATEMIAKANLLDLSITEVPTTLSVSIHPRTPHLKPIRDGLRHLKLMASYSFIKLFKKSFNLLVYILFPIYLLLLLNSPIDIYGVNIAYGTLFAIQTALTVALVLRSMLRLTKNLFPDFIDKNDLTYSKNFGLMYLTIGIGLYLFDLYYWSSNNFGFIDQDINFKILSITSIFLVYGSFEFFRLLIETTTEYFKKS